MELRIFRVVCIALFFLVLSSEALATENRGYLWGIFRYNKKMKSGTLGMQLQLRHSEKLGRMVEEQVNIDWTRDTAFGKVAGLFTFGTQDGFNKQRELRYALQWQDSLFETYKVNYNLRVRHELRDFTNVDKLLHRFRIRNEFIHHWVDRWWWEASSEFNWYLTEFVESTVGFASHRTIIGATQALEDKEIGIHYVNDYRKFRNSREFRHILSVTLVF